MDLEPVNEMDFESIILNYYKEFSELHSSKLKNLDKGYEEDIAYFKTAKDKLASNENKIALIDKDIASASSQKNELYAQKKLTGVKQNLESKLSVLENLIREENKKLQEAKATCKSRIHRISECVEYSQKYLGINISTTSRETTVFTFTQINKLEPSKEYYLEIQVTEDDCYAIIDSVPSLKDVKTIQDQLNASKDLLSCLAHIRHLFVKMQ